MVSLKRADVVAGLLPPLESADSALHLGPVWARCLFKRKGAALLRETICVLRCKAPNTEVGTLEYWQKEVV
jgi:hypothetical protein